MVKIEISDKLYKALEKNAKESGFKNVNEYLEFILKELVTDEEEISQEDEEKMKERLKQLGYL
ncbi:MAG: CopG family transcriptional regulator [Nanoarchaeota archaeon]|nr:CopG family transcriptional regulator [Nanoarchaeota archaeon]